MIIISCSTMFPPSYSKYYEIDQGKLHSNTCSISVVARCGFGWCDSLSVGFWPFFCGYQVLQEKVWGRGFCMVNYSFFFRFWWVVSPIISLFSQMVVDHCLVDFGTHVVGQTVSRVITMTNRGALGTHYTLTPVSTGPLQQTFTSSLVTHTDMTDWLYKSHWLLQ